MRNLQQLLIILGQQKLASGYLTSNGTALDTVMTLMAARDPIVTPQAPISPPDLLNTPAWIGCLLGQNGIYLNGVNGQLDLSHGQQPAYILALP